MWGRPSSLRSRAECVSAWTATLRIAWARVAAIRSGWTQAGRRRRATWTAEARLPCCEGAGQEESCRTCQWTLPRQSLSRNCQQLRSCPRQLHGSWWRRPGKSPSRNCQQSFAAAGLVPQAQQRRSHGHAAGEEGVQDAWRLAAGSSWHTRRPPSGPPAVTGGAAASGWQGLSHLAAARTLALAFRIQTGSLGALGTAHPREGTGHPRQHQQGLPPVPHLLTFQGAARWGERCHQMLAMTRCRSQPPQRPCWRCCCHCGALQGPSEARQTAAEARSALGQAAHLPLHLTLDLSAMPPRLRSRPGLRSMQCRQWTACRCAETPPSPTFLRRVLPRLRPQRHCTELQQHRRWVGRMLQLARP